MGNIPRSWAIGGLGVLALCLPHSANAATYSNASLNGTYGFALNLHTASTTAIQYTDIGILTFDGAGNAHWSSSYVSEGTVTAETFAGVYSVNSNGSGVLTLTGGHQYAIVLDNVSGSVASDVQLLRTDDSANETVTGNAVLQSTVPHTYSLASFKGTYAVSGYLISNNPAVSQITTFAVDVFDGKGGVKFSLVSMSDGTYSSETSTGTYTVNANGTYAATFLIGGANIKYIGVLESAQSGQSKGGQATIINDTRNVAYVISGHE